MPQEGGQLQQNDNYPNPRHEAGDDRIGPERDVLSQRPR